MINTSIDDRGEDKHWKLFQLELQTKVHTKRLLAPTNI